MKFHFVLDNIITNWLLANEQIASRIYCLRAFSPKLSLEQMVALQAVCKDLMLDSGAYFAYMHNKEINIDKLIAFIKALQPKTYIGLDSIGNAQKTYDNWLYMKATGLEPMPVFHDTEPFKYLRLYCEQCDYIGLGGLANITPQQMDTFFARCFSIIKKYWPKKIHAFAIAAKPLLKYPFYSADSSKWINPLKFHQALFLSPAGHLKGLHISKARQNKTLPIPHWIQLTGNRHQQKISAIKFFLEYQDFITKLWKQKGVTWNQH